MYNIIINFILTRYKDHLEFLNGTCTRSRVAGSNVTWKNDCWSV